MTATLTPSFSFTRGEGSGWEGACWGEGWSVEGVPGAIVGGRSHARVPRHFRPSMARTSGGISSRLL